MFLHDRTLENQLIAFSPRDLVPEDSDVWMYEDIFDQLDLENFYHSYSPKGQESVDPKLMLRTIFFGLTHGVQSGRKLEAACQSDVRYMVLSGGHKPNFRTFHRFLVRHMDQMEKVFIATIKLAQNMNLVSLGRVAIDGTRLRGYTSHHHSIQYGKADKTISYIKNSLEELKRATEQENAAEENGRETLPKEIQSKGARIAKILAAKKLMEEEGKTEPKSQRSLSDIEARPMGGRKAPFMFGYNAQAAVDGDNQIIVAAEAFKGTNDTEFLPAMVEQIIANADAQPDQVLVDSGYQSGENLSMLEEKDITAYVGLKRNKEGEIQSSGNFELYRQVETTEKGDVLCAARKVLPVMWCRNNTYGELRVPKKFCVKCPLQKECQVYKKRKIKKIRLASLKHLRALKNIYTRAATDPEYNEIYKLRQGIIEPIFGNIKYNKGLRLHIRGFKRVKCWWKMICAAINIERMINCALAGT